MTLTSATGTGAPRRWPYAYWRTSRSRYAARNLRRRHTRNRLMTLRMKSHKRHAAHQCSGLLEHAQVIGEYDAPAKQWLPGHRGLDLRARPQDAIIAPADGVVAFSGKVAGKSVVTLRHGAETGSLTSTFEPAVTTRPVGAVIAKGERFARVEGGSEHCADGCLHWGLKSGGRDYADPSGRVRPMRVELKPL